MLGFRMSCYSFESRIASKISPWQHNDSWFLGHHGNHKARLDEWQQQEKSQGCLDWHGTYGSGKSHYLSSSSLDLFYVLVCTNK
jgi:hypothetical protein